MTTTPTPLLTDLPEQMPQPDIRGWLTFVSPLPPALQAAEDATQANDHRLSAGGRPREREATAAEVMLLELIGYNTPPDLTTRVEFPSPGVRRRTWPALEGTTP